MVIGFVRIIFVGSVAMCQLSSVKENISRGFRNSVRFSKQFLRSSMLFTRFPDFPLCMCLLPMSVKIMVTGGVLADWLRS